jgi:hypothetical protein
MALRSVTQLIVMSNTNPTVRQFCKATGHRVLLHHNGDGRILLRVGSGNYASPAFGAVCELTAFCASLLAGIIARSI